MLSLTAAINKLLTVHMCVSIYIHIYQIYIIYIILFKDNF